MSTNCNKLQNSPIEEQQVKIKLGIPSPNHEIQPESHENRSNSDRRDEEDNTKIRNGEDNSETKITSRESEKSVPEEEEEGDGVRTPTSIDHKIPAITECPSPPRKIRPQYSRLKRRASPELCRCLRFVSAAEIESVLSSMNGEFVEAKRLKKAQTTTGDEI